MEINYTLVRERTIQNFRRARKDPEYRRMIGRITQKEIITGWLKYKEVPFWMLRCYVRTLRGADPDKLLWWQCLHIASLPEAEAEGEPQ